MNSSNKEAKSLPTKQVAKRYHHQKQQLPSSSSSSAVSSLETEAATTVGSSRKLITTRYMNNTRDNQNTATMVANSSSNKTWSIASAAAAAGSGRNKSITKTHICYSNTARDEESKQDRRKIFDFDSYRNGSFDDDDDDEVYYNDDDDEEDDDDENVINQNKNALRRLDSNSLHCMHTNPTEDSDDVASAHRSFGRYIRNTNTLDSKDPMFVVDWPTLTSTDRSRRSSQISSSPLVLSSVSVRTPLLYTNTTTRATSNLSKTSTPGGAMGTLESSVFQGNSGTTPHGSTYLKSTNNDQAPPPSLAEMLSRTSRIGKENWLQESTGGGPLRHLTASTSASGNGSNDHDENSDYSSDCITIHARNGGDYFSDEDNEGQEIAVHLPPAIDDDDTILADMDVGIQEAVVAIQKEASKLDAAIALDRVASMRNELQSTKLSLEERLDEIEELRTLLLIKTDRVGMLELERDLYLADAEKLQCDLNTCVRRMKDIEAQQQNLDDEHALHYGRRFYIPGNDNSDASGQNSNNPAVVSSKLLPNNDKQVVSMGSTFPSLEYCVHSDEKTIRSEETETTNLAVPQNAADSVVYQHHSLQEGDHEVAIVSPPQSVFSASSVRASDVFLSPVSEPRILVPEGDTNRNPNATEQYFSNSEYKDEPLRWQYHGPGQFKKNKSQRLHYVFPRRLFLHRLQVPSSETSSSLGNGQSKLYSSSGDESSSTSSDLALMSCKQPLLVSVSGIDNTETSDSQPVAPSESLSNSAYRGLKPLKLLEKMCLPVRHLNHKNSDDVYQIVTPVQTPSSYRSEPFSENTIFKHNRQHFENSPIQKGIYSVNDPVAKSDSKEPQDRLQRSFKKQAKKGLIGGIVTIPNHHQQHEVPSHEHIVALIYESARIQLESSLSQHHTRLRLAHVYQNQATLINELVGKMNHVRDECTNRIAAVDQFHRASIEELQTMIQERDNEIKLLRSVI